MCRPYLFCKSEKEASKCFSDQDLCALDTPFSIYSIPLLLGKDIEDAHPLKDAREKADDAKKR